MTTPWFVPGVVPTIGSSLLFLLTWGMILAVYGAFQRKLKEVVPEIVRETLKGCSRCGLAKEQELKAQHAETHRLLRSLIEAVNDLDDELLIVAEEHAMVHPTCALNPNDAVSAAVQKKVEEMRNRRLMRIRSQLGEAVKRTIAEEAEKS